MVEAAGRGKAVALAIKGLILGALAKWILDGFGGHF